jgi:HEPN domain-containing protein
MSHANDEFSRNLFNQIIQLWAIPELERRNQSLKEDNLRGIQVIFYPDRRNHEVRINDEIKAIGKVKLKPGIGKEKGEPIYENEVEGIEIIGLTEDDDVDCAHITLVRLLDTWFMAFDFRYNKSFSKKNLETAKEFYESARTSHERENWSAFVDNLFSSAELVAKATLLLMPDPKFRKKATHEAIQLRYNAFASLGNVPLDYKSVLNKLSGWRVIARYPKVDGSLKINAKDALNLLETVKSMINDCEKRIETKNTKD